MHCLCMLLVCVSSYLKSVLKYKYLILVTYHRDTIYVSKDGRIHGYCSKPKGIREHKSLENTGIYDCQFRMNILP
jgi:hypothetical protein